MGDQRERQDDDREIREPGDDGYAAKPRLSPDEGEPFPELCEVPALWRCVFAHSRRPRCEDTGDHIESDLSPKCPCCTQRIQQPSDRSADKTGTGLPPLRNGSSLAELITRDDHLDQGLFAGSVKSRRGSRERRSQNQDRQHSRLREEDGKQRERPPRGLRERRQTQDA